MKATWPVLYAGTTQIFTRDSSDNSSFRAQRSGAETRNTLALKAGVLFRSSPAIRIQHRC